jgi:hypothetical protein
MVTGGVSALVAALAPSLHRLEIRGYEGSRDVITAPTTLTHLAVTDVSALTVEMNGRYGALQVLRLDGNVLECVHVVTVSLLFKLMRLVVVRGRSSFRHCVLCT